jgi:hypothetical protein
MSMQAMSPRPLVECPACNGPLKSVGRLPIRRDIAAQGVITVAQPGEQVAAIGVDVYRCHECGRLEMYDHDFLLPSF